ncbi:glycosyltransferase family 25 protein [Ovoidimarina sediminis]|uniref:glycosyltransferase family 25 protein n=1 Tax=Ovoidimarina sediminis TaxID=3079856 RepID=UPI002908C5AE|nr:glycosyltransferase family 25 protein [Rhodophyticola sp. MJ-SS7]MDU8945089.1 glycosyltransferase family 25 protein [Rhodophyticola sp. MJ-SS7]
MGDLSAFIIHLDRATDRAAHVARMIADLPVPGEVLPAVDARAAPAGEMARHAPGAPLDPAYPFPLSDTEVAVFLSHRRAWGEIVSRGLPAALVLEDDVALDLALFPQALALARGREYAVVRLPQKDRERGETLAEAAGARLIRPVEVALGMQAQLVGRGAAARLLAASETFDRPVDVFLQMTWVHGADVLSVWPTGVRDISASLGGSTLKKRKGLGARLSAELGRARFRRRMADLARRAGRGG